MIIRLESGVRKERGCCLTNISTQIPNFMRETEAKLYDQSSAACYSREERAKTNPPTRFRLSVTGSVRKESDLSPFKRGESSRRIPSTRRRSAPSRYLQVNRKPHPSSLSRKVIRAGSSFSLPKPHTRENYGSRTKGEKASMLMA